LSGMPRAAQHRSGPVRPHGRQPSAAAVYPNDFRRLLITDAIMHSIPHIAQLVVGYGDITITVGYKAIYPEEVISGLRAFIARRRTVRLARRVPHPADAEWEEFL